jgi:hypothetical protein
VHEWREAYVKQGFETSTACGKWHEIMNVEQRTGLMVRLGAYMQGNDAAWQEAQQRAQGENNWFIPEFIQLSVNNIAQRFLQHDVLKKLVQDYSIPTETPHPREVGIVLAGNIPLVGFHDVLCTFIAGHYARVKPSTKDTALIKHLFQKLTEWNAEAATYLQLKDLLKGCHAYIATGGNNTARYFEYYFRNHPSIIRRARTSVAVLTGHETAAELEGLADDVHLYFGLGCRNVTLIYVPKEYDFVPLLDAFKKYSYFSNHNKYKNNYDYNLAVHLLNNKYYMTNGTTLVIENETPFSPISQLHYRYYTDVKEVEARLLNNEAVQCVVGKSGLPFGTAQCPGLTDFADGLDTMAFLKSL